MFEIMFYAGIVSAIIMVIIILSFAVWLIAESANSSFRGLHLSGRITLRSPVTPGWEPQQIICPHCHWQGQIGPPR